jgi:hypothetical protein
MSPPKIMHGARAQVSIQDPNTGASGIIGIFNSVSYGMTLDVSEVNLLGRFTAAELVYTGAETINVTASGYRAIDNGPHVAGFIPTISKLLTHEYITLTIIDRQSGAIIATISQVRPTGYSTGVNARSLEEVTFSYKGIFVEDESTSAPGNKFGSNTEPNGANFPF